MAAPASSVSRLRLLALGLAPALCVASTAQLVTHLAEPPAMSLVLLILLVPIGVFQPVRNLALWLGVAATVVQMALALTEIDSGGWGALFAAPGFLLVGAIAEELGRQCVIAERDHARVARLVEDLTPNDAVAGVTKWSHALPTFTREVARARRYKQPLVLLMVTPEHWERVCQRIGHDTSKAVVAEIGAHLVAACRNVDVVAYRDGANFGLLLPETPLVGAEVVAQRITSHVYTNQAIRLRAGLAAVTAETESVDTLIRDADLARSIAERLGTAWMVSRAGDDGPPDRVSMPAGLFEALTEADHPARPTAGTSAVA